MKRNRSKKIQPICVSNPQDILLPPSSIIDFPPIETRIQELPFDKLTWENFERLCYRLSGKNADAEYWQRYGRQGQSQAGIDIFVRRKDGLYDLWQCKRYSKKFTSKNLKDAVDAFLTGQWRSKANALILAVTMDLDDTDIQDTIEEQTLRLKTENIKFLVHGNSKLSEKIRPYPDLVDDFFGRDWVKKYCGDEAVANLIKIGQKLDGKKFIDLRRELFLFYKHFFSTLDRGLVNSTNLQSGVNTAPDLLDRFIVPDVIVKRSFSTYSSSDQTHSSNTDSDSNQYYQNPDAYHKNNRQKSEEIVEQTQRISVQKWLVDGNQVAILGDAGSGKSTLLRCLALDLLSNQAIFP